MALTLTATVSGTPNEDDFRAARFIVDQENERRAAADPVETSLPDGTNAELRDSYEVMLGQILDRAHASYIEQSDVATLRDAKALWKDATDAQRQAALAALQS